MKDYLSKVATALSQFVNAVILNGDPDESISGRAYRKGILEGRSRWAKASKVIDILFFFDKNHCQKAHEGDVQRAIHWYKTYANKTNTV